MKNLIENDDVVLPTFDKVFKFDIKADNIERMTSHMIKKVTKDAQRIHTKKTRTRSK